MFRAKSPRAYVIFKLGPKKLLSNPSAVDDIGEISIIAVSTGNTDTKRRGGVRKSSKIPAQAFRFHRKKTKL